MVRSKVNNIISFELINWGLILILILILMTNKLAVITGGTRGIGKSLINKFASRGFDISTCSRNIEQLKLLKKECESKFGTNVFVSQVDISKKDDVLKYAKEIVNLKRPVDVLINNAGIFIPGKITEEEDEVFEKLIYTNLFSAYYLTRNLLNSVKSAKNGHIFNICSTASIMAYPNGGSYSISKYGLLGFSRGIREELKDTGIKVTSVIPGATYTASWEGSDLPKSRFMKADDVARAISECQQLSPSTVVEELLLRPMLGDI